ncbi:hypothetical protein Taro_012298 [Colocasia esculenta]|uniref:BHLH domain-containing protein n=1 Tax=Colocasia esculenta TaxID=4460 RepID=A0A843UCG5_COLES|nr:hypothetical protein [Colocasia esculenta]
MESDEGDTAGSGVAASRRKLIRLAARGRRRPPPTPPQTRWSSSVQEKIYSRRLLEALRSTTGAGASVPRKQPSLSPSQAVKEAADSALALTAQGRTRWSRAILKRRWRVRKQVLLLKKASGVKARRGGARSPSACGEGKRRETGATRPKNVKVEERLRVLSRLVPGCRKASTPRLLDEAADYVAALELQVKAMRALADALSSASSSSSSVVAAAPPRSPPARPGSP